MKQYNSYFEKYEIIWNSMKRIFCNLENYTSGLCTCLWWFIFIVFRRILDGRKEMFEEDQGRNLLRMLYEILPERTGTKQRDSNLLGRIFGILMLSCTKLWSVWCMDILKLPVPKVQKVCTRWPSFVKPLFHTVSYCFILFHTVSYCFMIFTDHVLLSAR